ncbi:MAG TPA: hypothetical protein VNH44_14945 [Micropepsaceae bacterium]|nr:hypothetical protein [Micropepsaceae bacterium]
MSVFTIDLVLHVLAVVLWIGGVAMVTTIVIPAARKLATVDQRIALFATIERRFAWQARGAVIVVGLTGADMATRLGLWSQLHSLSYWWLCAMIGVWLIFAIMLFLVEPLMKHRFEQRMKAAPDKSFAAIQRMHWIVLLLSAIAIAGGVAGSHGLSLF